MLPSWNLLKEPLPPNKEVSAYHSAQNFTRFYGSLYADQPLEMTASFSNDEVTDDGDWPTDVQLPSLHYDALADHKTYKPDAPGTGKFFVIIHGKWIKFTVKNIGEETITKMRVYIRGSVF